MFLDPLSTICCGNLYHTLWFLVGSALIVGGLLYARVLIRSGVASSK